jgi:hypothetical protein
MLFIRHAARRDIDLAADNRLDARLLSGLVKGDGTVHHAVVGDGDSRLAELGGARNKPLDAAGAVKQAVFAVDMQMNKGHGTSPDNIATGPVILTLLEKCWNME